MALHQISGHFSQTWTLHPRPQCPTRQPSPVPIVPGTLSLVQVVQGTTEPRLSCPLDTAASDNAASHTGFTSVLYRT